jgi:hypothetical protein
MGAKQAQPAAPAAPPTPVVVIVEDTPSPQPEEPTAELVTLRRKVADQQQGLHDLQRKLDAKNDEIARLEESLSRQAKEIGRLTVASTIAGVQEAAANGLSEAEFSAARESGVVNFLVLETVTLWDGSRFEKGQGIDARQWPKCSLYIRHGLKLAAMPETGA